MLGAAAVVLALVFAWSRLFGIHDSLLFFIDMGRDANVLLTWQTTGRPPLLGPQTSALPFNQSAWYFYLLYPGFLLTHGSAFSAIYTTVVLYLIVWGALLWVVRKEKVWPWLLLAVGALVVVHPQFVIQNRFVWNPSWVGPSVLISVVALTKVWKQWSWRWLVVWAVASAAAVSFNYSAAPAVLAAVLLLMWRWRLRAIWFGVALMAAELWFNLPTLAFEVRHHFALTKMMLFQEKLPQTQADLVSKIADMTRFGIELPHPVLQWVWPCLLVLVASVVAWEWYRHQTTERAQLLRITAVWWFVTLAVTLMVPVSILSHYIFGYVTLGLVVIALLPRKIAILVVAVLLCFWLQPARLASYVRPARRTVAQMERCFAAVCADHHQPLFASVQAGFHPFHAAQEHRFLLRKAGCTVPEIDVTPNGAEYMAVVIDDSEYSHGKTAYNELTQFGASTPVKKYLCQDNFQVLLLKRHDR